MLSIYRKEYAKKHVAERKRYMEEWAQKNRERRLLQRKIKYENSPEKEKERAGQYYQTHKEERKKYASKYVKDHPEQYATYAAERHALKLNAMPIWVDKEAIKYFYEEAKRLTELTKIPHVVDHIWPLRGKGFNGLHVPWNLRVITSAENNSKSNKRPV